MGERHPSPLSARQRQILSLLSLGRSNREIAQQLRLSTGTVKQHLYALFRKLGVSNRTTAVIRAAQLAGGQQHDVGVPAESSHAPALPQELGYTRRLVTALVVEPRPEPVRTARHATSVEAELARLRERAALLAFAFDASFEPLPGGGAAVWFGQRVAHGDDAPRAVAFARALLLAMREAARLPCAIGIGTVPEVVGDEQRSSLAFRAFRVATLLASFAEPLAPLACETTVQLAGIADDPLEAPPGSPPNLPMAARALSPQPAHSGAARLHWGGLPFVEELGASVARGRSEWVAVESWPPEDGTRLIRALGATLGAAGLPVFGVWMPSPASAGSLNDRLMAHLRLELARHARTLAARRLDDALVELAAAGPAVLLAYGIDALPTLKAALQASTLERARTLPLVVVGGAMRRSGAPQTAVRLLGAHPAGGILSRVLRMTVPAAGTSVSEIRADVQAIIDRVSPLARAVARAAAEASLADAGEIAAALSASSATVAAACRELELAGLAVLDGGKLRFRDPETGAALRASLIARRA